MPARPKLAVLISGSGTNMAALLYASRAADCPFELVLVASNNPQAGGLALAAAEGVSTFALDHKGMDRAAHDAAMDAAIRASDADYVALAGYMRILTAEFVAGWHGRMVNIHPSLLPKYPGLHTHERALKVAIVTAVARCIWSPLSLMRGRCWDRLPWRSCRATAPKPSPPGC